MDQRLLGVVLTGALSAVVGCADTRPQAVVPTWRIEAAATRGFVFHADAELPSIQSGDQGVSTPISANPPSQVTLHFAWASAQLSSVQHQTLHKTVLSLGAPRRSLAADVTGYTDASTVDTPEVSNRRLARARAEAVREALLAIGLEPDQITTHARPLCCYVATNLNEEGRKQNRRVEIRFSVVSPKSQGERDVPNH